MSTTSPKSRFTKFLDQFAIGAENEAGTMEYVRWHGNVGYVSLGPRTIARIELSEFGHSGHWSGFKVSVVDGVTGRLDECSFKFHDYLTKEDRVDDRTDMPDQAFHAWESSSSSRKDLDWYIARPRSSKPVSNAINEYLRFWQAHRG